MSRLPAIVVGVIMAAGQAAAQVADTPAFDERLRASMAAAAAFQGPLDGGWVLMNGDRELYAFQFTDRAGVVDGAWRDPRRPGALEASGFLDQVERRPDGITLRMAGRVITLTRDAEGRLAGELSESGRSEGVILRRRGP